MVRRPAAVTGGGSGAEPAPVRNRLLGGLVGLALAVGTAGAAVAAGAETPVYDTGGPTVARSDRTGVAGRVVDRAGRPIHGVVVMVRKLDPPPVAIPEIANATDRNGRFFWPLAPGRYALSFHRDGRALGERTVVVGSGEATRMEMATARRWRR